MKGIQKKKNLIILFMILAGLLLQIPVVQAEIVLRIMAVNPSETRAQTIPLEAYLPREAGPDDILDLGDFTLDYDVEKGAYYVYEVVDLEPGQTLERSIRLRDIWQISQRDLEDLSVKARELVRSLEESGHFEMANQLSQDIERKQTEIVRAQVGLGDAMPQMRIATYRANKEKLKKIEENVNQLERLLMEQRLAEAADSSLRVPAERSWAIIWGVIIVLGVLSLIFFIIWNKQAGALRSSDEEGPEEKI